MIEYRKATIDDIDLLAEIRLDFLVEANIINSNEEKELMLVSNKQFMSTSLCNDSFVAWMAIQDGEVIATSGVSFYTLPPNKKCPNGKVAYISNMFTYPLHRKKGIASKLFDLTVKESIKNGCEKILLNATDMGRPIYEKFGFINTSNDMIYYVK